LRYLWWVSAFMIVVGLMAVIAGAVALGPVALIAGVLLVWAGIVKVIVLRIWQKTIVSGASHHEPAASAMAAVASRRTP
jgi:xanthine/uracil permease